MAKDMKNAISILRVVTKPFVQAMIKQKRVPEVGSDERAEMDEFVVLLETTWQSSLKLSDEKSSMEYMTDLFKELSQYRISLTPIMGPIFSDALRELKKRIRKHMENQSQSQPGSQPSNKRQKPS